MHLVTYGVSPPESSFMLLWLVLTAELYTKQMASPSPGNLLTLQLLSLPLGCPKYRHSQYYRSTSLHKYVVNLFSATFLKHKKLYFEIKLGLVL